MVFSSLSFLIVFLPVLVIIYYLIPAKWLHVRQYVLLLFSMVFYASGEPLYIFLIVACILLTWVLSFYVKDRSKAAVVMTVIINVIPLIVTKYTSFIVGNLNLIIGSSILQVQDIVMPIGISFYTFQVITYVVDLYNGKIERQKNILLFALYIMFFPQLIAGPIVKYSEVAKELAVPDISWENIQYGTGRLIIGLGKKVLIANQAGYIASTIHSCTVDSLSTGMVWLCIISFTIQIYFDFSGYSEMAIGLGAVFGFHFPENFRNPYTATSIEDFWQRWHITLSRFFREYVYIPLGGNRVSKSRWLVNIFVVWTLTGLWHGASWNFVIWGLYYGLLIVIERVIGIAEKLPKAIGWIVTSFLIMFGWGIFLNDNVSLAEMFRFLGKVFFASNELINPVSIGSLKLWGYLPFLVIGFLLASPVGVVLKEKIMGIQKKYNFVHDAVFDLTLIVIFVLSLAFLVGSTYNPFIYFRF